MNIGDRYTIPFFFLFNIGVIQITFIAYLKKTIKKL